jgi:acyl-CoA-binding protein
VRVLERAPNDSHPPLVENAERAKLHALYKQATMGRCTTSRPSFFDQQGRQRHDAWVELGDMGKPAAMSAYVERTIDLALGLQTTIAELGSTKSAYSSSSYVISSLTSIFHDAESWISSPLRHNIFRPHSQSDADQPIGRYFEEWDKCHFFFSLCHSLTGANNV